MGSWIPITPDKPIPTRPNPILLDRYGRPVSGENWQELPGFPVGHIQEMPSCNRVIHNLNPIGQAGHNEGYYGGTGFSSLERSRKINQIAASYAQALSNGSSGPNNSLTDLLAIKNAVALASANRSNGRSPSLANGALIPNLNSQVENWTESKSSELLIHNQANISSSNLSSNGSILQLISTDGFPIAYQSNYKQNAAPRTESEAPLCVASTSAFSTVTQELLKLQKKQLSTKDFSRIEADLASSVTTTLPPVTPDKFKKLQDNQLSMCETFSVDVSTSQANDKQENLLTIIGNETIQSNYAENVQNVAPSAVTSMSTPPEKKNYPDNANDRGIDLNMTPQQKPPKRRKHRPKVIVEGKPKKTPKTATPKSTKTNEKPGGKRKYVRRKGLKESATQQADIPRDTTDPSAGPVASSCRRVLNFDSEKIGDENQGEEISQQEEMQQSPRRTFNLDSQDKALDSGTNSSYGTQSTTMIGQQNGLPVEKQQSGAVNNHTHHQPGTASDQTQQHERIVCNQTLSMNRILADYTSIPERQGCAALPPQRKDLHMENLNVIAGIVDARIADTCQKGGENEYTPTQHHICAEGIDQTLFQAKTMTENQERTRQPMPPSTPQSAPKTSSSFQDKGSKREYSHAIEQIHPSVFNSIGSPLLYKDIFKMDGCHRNSNTVGADRAKAHKKKKIENGLYTIENGMPFGVHVIKDCSIQVQTKYANDINGNGSPLQRNNSTLGSQPGSYNIARAGKGAVNGLSSVWHARSMASEYNLPKQHIFSEQHLHTETIREANRWPSVLNFSSSTASEKHNLHPLTHPGRAPVPGDTLPRKMCQTNVSAKQNVEQTLVRSALSRMDQMLPEQRKDLYDPQQLSTERRGPPVEQIYPIPMDEIIRRFNSLNLNGSTNHVQEQEQNAIVPYKQDGTIVPYGGFEFIKKRKPRPKVDLDPETNRIWNLLMGKEGIEGLEEMDKEKEKWWEEERRVFQGRADSFIARMHLVQGDRRFSKWKGSVVDSVIGVFLTQNVSDHLSSSAFMSLAARFPLKSNNSTCNMDGMNMLVEEPEVCVLNPDDAIQWNEQVRRHPQSSQSSMTPTEHQRENEISGTERTSLLEQHSHSLEEEVISPQDSFSSSILQGHAGIKSYSGSNSETEDPTSGCQANKDHGSTNFEGDATLFQDIYNCLNDRFLFQERYGHSHKQSNDTENSQQESRLDSIEHFGSSLTFTQLLNMNSPQNQLPQFTSSNYQPHMTYSELLEGSEIYTGECITSQPSTACGFLKAKDIGYTSQSDRQLAEDVSETTVQQRGISMPEEMSTMSPDSSLRKDSRQQQTVSQPGSDSKYNQPYRESMSHTEPANLAITPANVQHVPSCTELTDKTCNDEERISIVNKLSENKVIEQNSREQVIQNHQAYGETNPKISKSKKRKADGEKKNAINWDGLRKQVQSTSRKRDRSKDMMDSLDYEAMRCADVKEISEAIKERGMNNMLAERIKEFLNRLVHEHGSIDLEWLRDVPPDKAKDYLLSIRGLGLKSVECVRLLTLHHLAFPVDTNVGRIAVRLGWVPLQPLPESLQLHLLELYPILESIQKYLWPRLCKLDQRTLYELHYQLITFGKVFCTKSKPNCNACPMRGECRHFASAFASARLALPGPEEKNIVTSSTPPTTAERKPAVVINPVPLLPPEEHSLRIAANGTGNCEPIIEEPATPDQECTEISESDIEDKFCEDPDEIPTIKLNIEEFTVNLQNYMQENMELQEGDMSKALVALNPEAASIPAPKLKNVSRLRTEHQVYQLPDSHPLLKGMDRREPDDPSPYLLAIWTPGETANSIQPSEKSCGSQESGKLCNEKTCFSCNSVREYNSQTVRGTLLIPCRTAMRGSFPLNGTYFQVNEVFADHESSLNPIDVPREWIWNLPRRIVYFGTSVSTIFKGLSTEGIQYCFWKGFVCVRGFDQKSRAPRPLMARLHFPASKLAKTKK